MAVAATSDEALRRADELQPDVTLVDICLGDEDGVDLAQRLSIAQQAPVILISVDTLLALAPLMADLPAGFAVLGGDDVVIDRAQRLKNIKASRLR